MYFTYFLFLYLTRKTINNHTPHLKPPNKPKQMSRLGTASNKTTGVGERGEGGGVQLVCGQPTLALCSALVPRTLRCSVCVEDP